MGKTRTPNPRAAFVGCSAVLGLLFLLYFVAEDASAVVAPDSFTLHQRTSGGAANFTFMLAADDPDQTTGSYSYSILVDGSATPITQTAVVGRDTWVFTNASLTLGLHEYKIRASDGFSTADSCTIQFNYRGSDSNNVQKACGANSTIAPVPGVSAVVVVAGTSMVNANTTVEYEVSPDDPGGAVGGEFRYTLVLCSQGNTYALCDDATKIGHSAPAAEIMGNRTRIEYPETGPVDSGQKAYIAIEAFDHKTHRRAVFSCQVVVDLSQLYSKDNCGTLPEPSNFLSDDGPQVPFVDLPTLAEPLGLTSTQLARLMGAVFFAGVLFIGFRIAGLTGGIIGMGLGVALGAMLNIIPLWVVVLTFMAAAGFVIWQIMGGGSSD